MKRIIEPALMPGRFISFASGDGFIGGLEAVKTRIDDLVPVKPALAQSFDETFLAGWHRERFITYGMQIAAHEAKLGHGKFAQELRRLIDAARKRRGFAENDIDYADLAKRAEGLSFAEITRACEDAIKEKIIMRKEAVGAKVVARMLDERKNVASELTSKSSNIDPEFVEIVNEHFWDLI